MSCVVRLFQQDCFRQDVKHTSVATLDGASAGGPRAEEGAAELDTNIKSLLCFWTAKGKRTEAATLDGAGDGGPRAEEGAAKLETDGAAKLAAGLAGRASTAGGSTPALPSAICCRSACIVEGHRTIR